MKFAVNVFIIPPVGLEPTIYRLEVCRLIHWATGAFKCLFQGLYLVCWI